MGSVAKERLDVLVFEYGLSESREKAKRLIMAGLVLVNGEREDKPGSTFPRDVNITLKGKPLPFVSRGGLKLDKAVREFGLDLKEKICMDAGASTGGFTDCMLQNGAVKVYSVDVGYGQLDWKLRNDERVVCMEKTNIRYMTPDMIDDRCDFASIDVSFISLTMIIPPVKDILKDDGEMVALIKPQFEAGKENVGKKGVVREPKIHMDVIEKVILFARSLDMRVKRLSFSPVKGPEGNIEYLLYLTKDTNVEDAYGADYEELIKTVVKEAHDKLNG